MSRFNGVDGEHLASFVHRIERLEEKVRGLNQDKSQIYKEVRACGYYAKVAKKVIALRRMDPDERAEQDQLTAVYTRAIESFEEKQKKRSGTPVAARACTSRLESDTEHRPVELARAPKAGATDEGKGVRQSSRPEPSSVDEIPEAPGEAVAADSAGGHIQEGDGHADEAVAAMVVSSPSPRNPNLTIPTFLDHRLTQEQREAAWARVRAAE